MTTFIYSTVSSRAQDDLSLHRKACIIMEQGSERLLDGVSTNCRCFHASNNLSYMSGRAAGCSLCERRR